MTAPCVVKPNISANNLFFFLICSIKVAYFVGSASSCNFPKGTI